MRWKALDTAVVSTQPAASIMCQEPEGTKVVWTGAPSRAETCPGRSHNPELLRVHMTCFLAAARPLLALEQSWRRRLEGHSKVLHTPPHPRPPWLTAAFRWGPRPAEGFWVQSFCSQPGDQEWPKASRDGSSLGSPLPESGVGVGVGTGLCPLVHSAICWGSALPIGLGPIYTEWGACVGDVR